MNYHIEHHMFPMVPYHALPELHEELQALHAAAILRACFDAYREIIPALWRQRKEPDWHVEPKLPDGCLRLLQLVERNEGEQAMGQWIEVCAADDIDAEDVMRFDHGGHTFAIYRSPDDEYLCHRRPLHP